MKLSCTRVMLHANTRKRLCGFNSENRRRQRTAIWAQQRTVINGPGDPWEWTTQQSSTNTACFQLFYALNRGMREGGCQWQTFYFFLLSQQCTALQLLMLVFMDCVYCVSNEWILKCQFRFQFNYTFNYPECCLGGPDQKT